MVTRAVASRPSLRRRGAPELSSTHRRSLVRDVYPGPALERGLAFNESENTGPDIGSEWITLDGKTYTLSANSDYSDYSETTLLELTTSGELVPGAKIEGWTSNVIRIR